MVKFMFVTEPLPATSAQLGERPTLVLLVCACRIQYRFVGHASVKVLPLALNWIFGELVFTATTLNTPLAKWYARPAPGEPRMLAKLLADAPGLNNVKVSLVVSVPARFVTVSVPP